MPEQPILGQSNIGEWVNLTKHRYKQPDPIKGQENRSTGPHRMDNEPTFSDDGILPSQMVPGEPCSPHKALFVAVLQVAIHDAEFGPTFAGHVTRPSKAMRQAPNPKVLAEARAWFLSEDRQWEGSFLNVCEALDLEPSKVREKVQERWV